MAIVGQQLFDKGIIAMGPADAHANPPLSVQGLRLNLLREVLRRCGVVVSDRPSVTFWPDGYLPSEIHVHENGLGPVI